MVKLQKLKFQQALRAPLIIKNVLKIRREKTDKTLSPKYGLKYVGELAVY